MQGNEIIESDFVASTKISLKGHAAGIYLVKVKSNNGVAIKKLIYQYK